MSTCEEKRPFSCRVLQYIYESFPCVCQEKRCCCADGQNGIIKGNRSSRGLWLNTGTSIMSSNGRRRIIYSGVNWASARLLARLGSIRFGGYGGCGRSAAVFLHSEAVMETSPLCVGVHAEPCTRSRSNARICMNRPVCVSIKSPFSLRRL